LLDRWHKFMKFPPAAKGLVKRDELPGGVLLRYDIFFLEFEFLTLGVEDVQIIRQAAIVPVGGKLRGLAGGCSCAIEVLQAILFGPVGGDRIVDLLDSAQYRLFVTDQAFMCTQLGDVGYCIECAEIKVCCRTNIGRRFVMN
jgi:hypothetical protein